MVAFTGSCKPQRRTYAGTMGVRYAIDLSRVMLLDGVSDYAASGFRIGEPDMDMG